MGKSILIVITILFGALVPVAAHAEWREARSPHFVVVSDGSERELVRMSQRLEAVHWMLGLVTGVRPDEDVQPVKIYLVNNIAAVHRAMGITNANSGVAGFYRPQLTGAIAVVPRSEGQFSTTILYHEYAHHYLLQYLDIPVPGWLNEGFAEFISTASFEREGHITIGHAARHRTAELENDRWTPISRMFAPRSINDREAGVANYGQYWVVTHYLISTDERRRRLNLFTNALNRGTTVTEANSLFGGLDVLDREVRAYSRRSTVTARLAPLPPGVMAAPAVRLLRPAEAAIIPLEFRTGQRLDDEEKTALANEIAAVVARFPDDPAPALLQTQILFEQENWAGAIAAADRALTADPESVRARAWKGWAQIHAMEEAGRLSDADISAARRLIAAANRAAPDDPIPLLAYFNSFALAGQPMPEMAVEGVYRASVLVPQADEVRMLAAMALLTRRDVRRARQLLAPLAFSPHLSGQQTYALQLVGWIDAGATGEVPQYIDIPIAEIEVADR